MSGWAFAGCGLIILGMVASIVLAVVVLDRQWARRLKVIDARCQWRDKRNPPWAPIDPDTYWRDPWRDEDWMGVDVSA